MNFINRTSVPRTVTADDSLENIVIPSSSLHHRSVRSVHTARNVPDVSCLDSTPIAPSLFVQKLRFSTKTKSVLIFRVNN